MERLSFAHSNVEQRVSCVITFPHGRVPIGPETRPSSVDQRECSGSLNSSSFTEPGFTAPGGTTPPAALRVRKRPCFARMTLVPKSALFAFDVTGLICRPRTPFQSLCRNWVKQESRVHVEPEVFGKCPNVEKPLCTSRSNLP